MAQRRKPSRPPAKRPPAKRPKALRSQQPFRRRRSMYSQQSQRNGVLFVVVAVFLGIVGIAVANAFSSSNSSVSDTAANQEPTPAATSASPTPSATRTPAASKTASPKPVKTRDRHTAEPVATPKSTPKPTPKPTATPAAACPPAAARVSRARAGLRYPSALPQATVVTRGPRSGTLATADPPSRTITLYLRSCAEESTQHLAVVWMFEAGQLLDVRSWDSSTQGKWEQLRGASFGSTLDLQRDVAAVFAYWQTGTTQWWQSPVAPPTPSRLAQLAPYLQ